MKLLAKDKHNEKRKESEIIGITRDGWVITKDGSFGDSGIDCEILLNISSYLKKFRKSNDMTQQELSWMLGRSRTTVVAMEQGKAELSLKDFLILAYYIPDNEFGKLRKKMYKA